MCSGKTRVGRELARLLGRQHVDLDRRIEEQVGPLLPFFKEKGEAEFRRMEAEVIGEVARRTDVVVSTGGGTPMAGDNMARMKAAGTVVWLDVPIDVLMPRIERAGGDRPLLHGLKENALHEKVNDLLASRLPVYARAQWRMKATGTPAAIADRIRQLLDLHAR